MNSNNGNSRIINGSITINMIKKNRFSNSSNVNIIIIIIKVQIIFSNPEKMKGIGFFIVYLQLAIIRVKVMPI